MKKSNRSDRYNLNFEKDEFYIKEFCNAQSNFTDTIRYLIEEDIRINGIRNLQEYIPSKRHSPINQLGNNNQEKGEEKLSQEQTIIEEKYYCYSD